MFLTSLQTVVIVAALIAVGYVTGALGWFKGEHKLFITKLITNFALPGTVVSSVFRKLPLELFFSNAWFVLIPFISIAFCYLSAMGVARLLKLSKSKAAVFTGMCAFSNTIFIGFPVCTSLFGDVSIPYVLFFYAVNTLLYWSVCVPRMKRSAGLAAPGIKSALNAPLVTLAVSLPLALLGFAPPAALLDVADYLGALTSPLSLIFIGKVIHEYGFKGLRLDKSIAFVLLYRFVVNPTAAFSLGLFVGLEPLATQVLTMQAAMPIMFQTVVSADEFGADSRYAANTAIISTLVFLAFIPLYMSLMPLFFGR